MVLQLDWVALSPRLIASQARLIRTRHMGDAGVIRQGGPWHLCASLLGRPLRGRGRTPGSCGMLAASSSEPFPPHRFPAGGPDRSGGRNRRKSARFGRIGRTAHEDARRRLGSPTGIELSVERPADRMSGNDGAHSARGGRTELPTTLGPSLGALLHPWGMNSRNMRMPTALRNWAMLSERPTCWAPGSDAGAGMRGYEGVA